MKTIEGFEKEDRLGLVAILEVFSGKTTIGDIRRIDKICKVLEDVDKPLSFEDADYEYLKQRLSTFEGWNPGLRQDILRVAEILEL